VDLLHVYSKHCDANAIPDLVLKSVRSRRPAVTPARAKTARQLRPAEVDALITRYQQLGSVAEVAREFGVTRQTVGMHLAARGIDTIRRMSEADIATATELYRDGRSAATIGRRLGFNAQTVLTALRSVGVPIQPRTDAL